MHRSHHYIASLFLTAALAAPLSLVAAPRPQEAGVQVRVYDKQHKDYHNWDDNEDRAYAQFRGSHPTFNVTFGKTSSNQQTTYWNWRHANPDKN